MANPKLRFRFHEPTIDTNMPLTDGTVKVEGFELEFVTDDDADAWDQGFGALLHQQAASPPWVSIPAFPNCKFRLSYIFVHEAARIESPATSRGSAWESPHGAIPPECGQGARCRITTGLISPESNGSQPGPK